METPDVVKLEQEIKELKIENKRLENVIEKFKKNYSNWERFAHQLGL